ncbi:MAG: hypothetical protein AAGA57_09095 [Planctomycetota bacterium]
MIATLGWNKRSPIGIDVGRRRVHAVQLERRRGWRVAAAVSVSRQHEGVALSAEEAIRLRGVLQRAGFRGVSAVLAAGPQSTVSSTVQGPAGATDTQLDAVVRHELAGMRAADPQAMEAAWWPLPQGPRQTAVRECQAVGLLHDDAHAMLDPLEQAGFEVCSIDTPATALHRFCGPRLAEAALDGRAFAVLLDVGWTGVRIYVFDALRVRYQRSLNDPAIGPELQAIGANFGADTPERAERVVRQMMDSDDVHDANPVAVETMARLARIGARLATEARKSIDYVQGHEPGATLRGVWLCGGGAGLAPLRMGVEHGLAAEVSAIECLGAAANAAPDRELEPYMATAAGLALWGRTP